MFLVRQGDVLVLSTSNFPIDVKPVARDEGRIVLAYGEATGHAHAILDPEAQLFASTDSEDRFLRVMSASGVQLYHEEHAPIMLPRGDFLVRPQREYTAADMAPVRVTD